MNIREKLIEMACKRPRIRYLMPEKCGCELDTVQHKYGASPSITNTYKCNNK